ncbi:ribbon-helix-helix domain-containing protein [Meridianimarinicoccus aquatilis]|uniref:Aryl-sulfate sulfotransferase n=1 Tax=Meridianimarinicoccus aquatilis TaxID=2552766 RepID=A0A4V3BC11_9RHOB|nr:ribbon-helix-helix domain-containing protein [Fluviibacterium aquatile]QIE42534.1 ribbon-helix-helix domain-containing protein [Rhodobacteraceae bacterium SC52]TDL89149.1 aryl-sulfate sulfotransferase [Fluviibacterium aquatile]
MTDARPRKRSLTLKGHQTSVSLEDAFWISFRDIANAQGKAVNALAAEIDAARGLDCGLASAIRVFVLNHYRDAVAIMDQET